MMITSFDISKTYDFGGGLCDYRVSFDCRMVPEEFKKLCEIMNDGHLRIGEDVDD